MRQSGKPVTRVTVDITTRCNLKCVMCPRSSESVAGRDLPAALFASMASDLFPSTEELFLSCAYESTMSGVFADIMRCVGQYRVPKSALVTNGVLLAGNALSAVIEAGLSFVAVSVDGATPATYERIRRGARFSVLKENLRSLARMKKERGTARPAVDLTYTLMRSNLREMPMLVDLAHEVHASTVNYKPVQVHFPSLRHEALIPADAEIIRENLEAARERAAERGIEVHTAPELDAFIAAPRGGSPSTDAVKPGIRCVEPFPSVYIKPDGSVLPCTLWKELPMGNLSHEGFWAIWESADYRRFREEFSSASVRRCCERCWYLIDDRGRAV